MPNLLTRSDLRELSSDIGLLNEAIDRLEGSLIRSHLGDAGETTFTGVKLPNGDELANQFTSCSTGASLRLFPRVHEGPRQNARLGIRISRETGEVETLICLDDFNELRTAVPAAVGVRHLAPECASRLTVLGSGAQAHSHVRTISQVMPQLEAITVWSPTQSNRERFAEEVGRSLSVPVTAAPTVDAAVDGSDVITAAGRYHPGEPALPRPEAVSPGSLFVTMTGSGMNLLSLGARFVVPTRQHPELIAQGFSSGFLSQAPPTMPSEAVELADVMLDHEPARSSSGQTVVFELGAPYLWDLPILDWINDWAIARELGTSISFSD
ncbi:hypothetical protein [Brevibacterium atlanticum]|uniref:hypothetical protein n=1 Tax=Brevibacterium atlanticum TaxID=2697563 RepID=UPI00141F4B41|nr:hypothetical protein [Brevibacterium atlanticum]